MQAIAVTGPEAVDVARSYESVTDFFLLDSVDPTIPGVGASGVTHDWSISARIVSALDRPVFLAGGLRPHNVGEAVNAVGPWAVDVCSGVRRDGALDPALLTEFVAALT